MQKTIIFGACLLAIIGSSASAQSAVANATAATQVAPLNTLSIQIQGVGTRTGQVMLSVCNQEGFNGTARCEFSKIVPIAEIGRPIVLENIPNGTYGVKLFHDVNGNNQLDTNAMGIPREPYAFSNNAKGRFGPAKFEDAAFTIDKATTIAIRLY